MCKIWSIENFDDMYSHKDIYDDAIYYEHKEGEFSGIEKCIKECKGNCVEYGYTANAWCFE